MAETAVNGADRRVLTPASYPEIQALVFTGHAALPYAGLVAARVPAATTRAYLAELAPRIAWASAGTRDERRRAYLDADGVASARQVGLGPGALRALGVGDADLDTFPQELTMGMAARCRLLGDDHDADDRPVGWHWGSDPPDVVVLVYGQDAAGRDRLLAEEDARLARHGGAAIAVERSARWEAQEPFGFADGLSQPLIEGTGAPAPGQDVVPAGEFVLGYHNAYGYLPASPARGGVDVGEHGTYVVVRKLEQHVDVFWRYVDACARDLAGRPPVPAGVERARAWIASRIMGRWTNGNPILDDREEAGPRLPPDQINAFGFLDRDPHGLRCPINAHVRRANPRDARGGTAAQSRTVVNRHRILRRGRAYDAPDGTRGLLFVSVQASIARGFEFVQQLWLSNPAFHGAYQEPDPITGRGGAPFTIPATPVRLRLPAMPRVVTPRGGGYFFLPGRRALATLLS